MVMLPTGLLDPMGLTPEQQAAVQKQAQQNALLNFGLQALAGSQAVGYKPSTLQVLGQAGQSGLQAYQGTFDQQLQNMLRQQQMADAQRKRKQEEEAIAAQAKIREALPGIMSGQSDLSSIVGLPGGLEAASNIATLRGKLTPPKDYIQSEGAIYEKTPAGLIPVVTAQNKFTGDYANAALGLFGTANIGDIQKQDPEYFPKVQQEVERISKAKAAQVNLPAEGERKAGTLTNRIQFNIAKINEIVGAKPQAATPETLPTLIQELTGSEYFKSLANSEERQRIEAAQLDILDAALTLGTGAAYTREQLENYRTAYFPQLGDRGKPQVVADKQERLQNLLDSAFMASGRAAPPRLGAPAAGGIRRYNPATGRIE